MPIVDETNIIAHVHADLARGTVQPVQVECTQYDAEMRVIAVHLKENNRDWEIPSGYAVNVRMRKADGTGVYNPQQGEGNIAYITLSAQMCGVAGTQYFVVEIVKGDDVVQTIPIRLNVRQNPIDDTTFTSSDEYKTIQGLVEEAQDAAEESQENANQAYTWAQNTLTLYHQTEDLVQQVEEYAQKILGADAKVAALSQSEYEALNPPDPKTVYIVVGDSDPTPHLKAYYPLSADVADMLSGRTGSIVGGGSFADGALRTAPAGTVSQHQNYIQLPENLFEGLELSDYDGITIALDVMPDTTCAAGNGDWTRLLQFYKPANTPEGTAEGDVYLTQGCIGTAYYNGSTTQALDATVASSITAGEWHTVVMTVSGFGVVVNVYVDGDLVVTGQDGQKGIISQMPNFTQNYIGNSRFSDNDFVGLVRNLRVYNKALTSTEIGSIGSAPSWTIYFGGAKMDDLVKLQEALSGLQDTVDGIIGGTVNIQTIRGAYGQTMDIGPNSIGETNIGSTGSASPVNLRASVVNLLGMSHGAGVRDNVRITSVADPQASNDATNKAYVDTELEDATSGLASTQYVDDAIDNAISAIANAPRYGVRFSGSGNSGSTVTRLYDAVGLTAAVGTDTATAANDFDGIAPWSTRRRCCGYWDDVGQFVINAYEGEPGYTTDGSNGEVWVESSLWYYQHTVSEDGVEEIIISTYQYPGFSPAPIFLSQGGQAQPYLKAYTAAYPMATVDGKPTSRSGVFPGTYSLNTAMTAARMEGENYCTTTAGEWYSDWLLMVVEFATRNPQAIMVGATQLPWTTAHTALEAETGVNRIIISAANASDYVVGQTIGIGTDLGGNQVCSNRRVTSIEAVEDGTALNFDGDPVDIAVGNMVYSLAWITGTCDGVQSSSGSYTSNTSGTYQCIYRGKEKPYGDCFEWCCDVLFQRHGAGTADDPYTYTTHYLPDPTKYSGGTITEDYVQLGYGISAQDGYSTALGLDERFPWVRIPSAIGGSTTTYYSDYYQYPRYAVTTGRLGGSWYSLGDAGPASWYCNNAPSYSWATYRARLSFHRT